MLFLPVGSKAGPEDDTPRSRIDEREIMFARARLQPGTPRFDEYYRRKPEHKAPDDRFRSYPGLLSPEAGFTHPLLFAAAEASFAAVAQFHAGLEAEPAEKQVPVDPQRMTEFLKRWARKLGAVSAGVSELRGYHVYSHLGRNEPYGAPLEPEQRYALALTVEMDKHMLDYAPQAPVVMESAQQYLVAGAIAVQIAEFIRRLGYPARAHIDGNYRVVCPLVARDAGLGEIGRMGLLMTPELGPRVRIAVVTTDLPLVPTPRKWDASVLDFCTHCKKCAAACPSRSIPFGDRQELDGLPRWQINSETCFTYWCKVGTDCARCVRVCPYSHPDNWLHNLVRFGVRRSLLFRRLAIPLDDWLYGRKPKPARLPEWLANSSD